MNTFSFSASAGFIFPEDPKTSDLFGTIYEGSVSFHPWNINIMHLGITSNFLYKKSNPFSDDYLQDPDLNLRLTSFGTGPLVAVRFNNIVSIGMLLRLNYIWITYPESSNNSIVSVKTIGHTAFGFEFFGYFTPISVKGINFGLAIGLHVTTYGRERYYYYYDYDLFDNLSITGFAVKIVIAR